MKIRNSFVTNSSSSSYIVAIKKDIKTDDLLADLLKIYKRNKSIFIFYINKYIKELQDTLVEYLPSESLNIIEKSKSNKEALIDLILPNIVSWLKDGVNSELDSWRVGVVECSSEDGGISSLLYDLGHVINGEYIKLLS